MKTENLYVGLVAKNYKHLCEIVDDEVKAGSKSKKLQMNRWKCYFNAIKDGQKITITEIYDTPKPLPQHGGSRTIITYLDIVKQLMIQMLLCSDTKSIIIAKNSFLYDLNMININYKDCKQHISSLSEYMNIEQQDIYEFYNSTNSMLKRNIENSLNELQNSAHIIFDTVTMINKDGIIRKSTSDERDLILEVIGNTMNDMDFKNMNGIIKSGRYDEYMRNVNAALFKLDRIRYTYKAYDISLNKERLEKELVKMEMEDRIIKEFLLNDEIQDRIKENIVKRHERAVAKDSVEEFFVMLSDNEERRVSESYVENHYKLTDALINRKHESLVDDVRKLSRQYQK